jgi:hypothetical protein
MLDLEVALRFQIMPYLSKSERNFMAIINISTLLKAPLQQVAEHTAKPALLAYVAAPLLQFQPVNPAQWPEQWADGGQYRIHLWQFGFIPLGWQIIRTHIVSAQADHFVFRDRGLGMLARTWDHTITLLKTSDTTTLYSDSIEIKAGLLTPFVVSFAAIFYRWRQHRWHRLIARQFNYSL